MKQIRQLFHEKEFDTKTIFTDLGPVTEDTKETMDRKTIAGSERKTADGQKTQKYEPRPLTPDDDIYEDIIEQFASAPTKPKYWFEEFGDYWSCSCGHINKGDICKSCGLERNLLRSLFILHKPLDAPGKLDKKLRKARHQADREDQQQMERTNRLKQREASGADMTEVIPIQEDTSIRSLPAQQDTIETEASAPEDNASKPPETVESTENTKPEKSPDSTETKKNADSMEAEKSAGGTVDGKGAGNDHSKPVAFNRRIIAAILICIVLIAGIGAGIYLYNDTAVQSQQPRKLQTGINAAEPMASRVPTLMLIDPAAILDSVDAGKLSYVQEHLFQGDTQAETYMMQLMDAGYPGIQEIYDEYYAWHVSIIANTSEDDFSTDLETVSRKDTVYFHTSLSGGEPDETIALYYEVTWPNGTSQIYSLDSVWQDGSRISARFQYPIPLFGAEGTLTFNLYEVDTQELLGSDTVTFAN